MSEVDNPDNLPSSVLPEEQQVYRKGVFTQHFSPKTRQLRRQAFMRRSLEQDPNGLSVDHNCALESLIEGEPQPIAIGELSVGAIRKIPAAPNLDVIPDSLRHANITGLPARGEDIPKAERLAEELAKICRCIYPSEPV